jgi:hypothetical protein
MEAIDRENNKIRYQSFIYHFSQNIEFVWDFLKDVKKTYQVLSNLRSAATFTKGSNSYELGAEFEVTWVNYRRLYNKVEKVEESDFQKILVLQIHSEPTYQNFKIIYNLFRVSVDDSTVFKLEFKYEGDGLRILKEEQDRITEERLEMMKRIENYLKSFGITQFESITLNCKLKHIWKIITNWKVLFKLLPELGEECHHEPNFSLEEGKTFQVFWNKEKGIISDLKIKKIIYNEQENLFEFDIFNNGSVKSPLVENSTDNEIFPKDCMEIKIFPKHELKFRIIKINDNFCHLEYRHVFLDSVNRDYVNKIAESKRKMLVNLKKALKDLYFDNYNRDSEAENNFSKIHNQS